ncbi:MAG: hydrogenase 4 subunit F [Micropepsaceae bacterium]
MMGLPFDATAAVLGIPFGSALILIALPGYRITSLLNVFASALTFLSALQLLILRPESGQYILVDDLNIVFIVLNTLVAFTTSWFSASYIAHELETGRLTPAYLRFYHGMYQFLMFAMNLALVANNIGLMWVAIEMATLTTVLLVGIYRTHEAIEAAWKYFILGSVGIALALFGTILVYMAARPAVGEGIDGMLWTVLIAKASGFDPALLNVAFVFLLLGYGTKVGLAPLHAWLPDAHAEGPTPISAVLSGLLLNVALYAVLRFKLLLAANGQAISPGPLMAMMGLISVIFASFMLYRRRDVKRMFAYSSIEHMGIITFAFGMGGPLANFAGLLHMTMHSLTKSAIFFAVGHVSQIKGTQKIAEISGLTETHPLLGWGLVIGVAAIIGLPPSGIFMSEFLIVSSTFARDPLLAGLLVFGLLIGFGALMLRLIGLAFGEPKGSTAPVEASYVPLFFHLAIVISAGIYLPEALVEWFQHVARLLG